MPFNHSYMITNRANPMSDWSYEQYPLPPSQLNFFLGAGQYNPNISQFTQSGPTAQPPTQFLTALTAEARAAGQITVVIHGLDNFFDNATQLTMHLGAQLTAQQYSGLVIGFSWPSYGLADSTHYYGSLPYSFPPTATNGTIRDNINGSVQSFFTLVSMLRQIKQSTGVRINFVCHSEGNYMMMLGMRWVSLNQQDPPYISLDEILLVAADINNAALQLPNQEWAGQAHAIADLSSRVTIYSSQQDDVLPFAEGWTDYHNPQYPKRLGLHGPASFVPGPGDLDPKAIGLDCTSVVQPLNPNIPPGVTTHGAYFYIPQVIADMRDTLNGVAANGVKDRVSADAPDGRGFVMTLQAGAEPLRPTGRVLAAPGRG